MPDNIAVTPGSGATIGADDVGGVLIQRIKATFGPDGTATDVSTTTPLPVTMTDLAAGEYETVAASQTNQAIGATGATGDYLAGLLVIPATTSPGAITIKDGANAAITVFAGGASSVSNLVPFFIPLGIKSTVGAWQVTTGANVSVLASGNFT